MPTIHLRPVPSAQIVQFPENARQNPETVLAQLRNIQAILQRNNGTYLGRAYFAEAAVWVIAQTAADADDVTAARNALMDDFETALRDGPPVGFFSGAPEGAA